MFFMPVFGPTLLQSLNLYAFGPLVYRMSANSGSRRMSEDFETSSILYPQFQCIENSFHPRSNTMRFMCVIRDWQCISSRLVKHTPIHYVQLTNLENFLLPDKLI